MPMTLDLNNLRKLEAAATPGPWEYGTATCCPDMGWVDGPAGKGTVCPQYQATKTTHTLDAYDAELIAEMRNALPALLADHARLTDEVADLRDDIAAGEQGRAYLRSLVEKAEHALAACRLRLTDVEAACIEWQRLAQAEARDHLATTQRLIETEAALAAARAEALHLRQALNERNVL